MSGSAALELPRVVAVLLEPHGFRRTGNRFFNRSVPAIAREIEIEKFRWNTAQSRRFRFRVAIYVATPETGEFVLPGRDGLRYSLAFRADDGLLEGKEGQFHVLPPDPREPAFLAELRHRLETVVLPPLAAAVDVDAIIALVERQNRVLGWNAYSETLAVALARLGWIAESRAQFLKSPADPALVRQIAARHGVSLD